jgi:2,5-furandicarboxylate decarboxylase 1
VDVAISIGVDPAIFVSAFWPCGPAIEEFGVAGALMKQPVVLTPALTVDVAVPAHAEIVIEGRIHPGNEEIEGPFADITGQITSSGKQPVIDVTAITMRQNPIYHTVLGFNSREHFKSRNNDFWRDYQVTGRVKLPPLQLELGNDYRIYFPPAARNFHAVVSLKKSNDSQPRHIIDAVFQTYKYLKRVIVVDDDIDITDHTQIEWALATRVGRPEQVIINAGLGSRLDKSAKESGGEVIKMGIDATVPMELRAEILRPGLGEAGYVNTQK